MSASLALPPHQDQHLVDDLETALLAAGSQRQNLDRKNVPSELLGRANNTRLVWFTLVDWAWIAAFWVGMTYAPTWTYPLWVVLIAGRIHSFGVILHDAAHQSIKRKSWQIRIVEIFAGYPMASTLNAMRYHHIRHHRDSGMAADPYFKPKVAGRPLIFFLIWLRHILLVPLWMIRGPYGLLAYLIPGMRNSYARVFLQDKSGEDLTHLRELIDCCKAELGQVVVHAGLFTFAYFRPEEALFYYFIPAIVAALFAGHRVLVEHNYTPVTDRRMETIMRTTVDHNMNWLGRIFLAPRNIGFHIAHHLHPQVALENLPKLRQWYLHNHPEVYPNQRTGNGL
ncbi:fatty acid desaturase [Aquipseudomonas campi]|uniref:Fatty acid desaturase n=1 Tax=Aquipseudomonas campi TaxID=2731681 RepID=A0A6M8FI13_9GAMM|nr:fatty acid desaturase [Pseudomonas campi]QKE63609.1 fatty acid desaturase [Pseudomonas campi]